MQMAQIAPGGMVFLSSRGGTSHNPLEYTDIEDVAAGAEVLFWTLYHLAEAHGKVATGDWAHDGPTRRQGA